MKTIFRPIYPSIYLHKKLLSRTFLILGYSDLDATISFDTTVSDNEVADADRSVSLSITANLDKISENQLDTFKSILFNILVDQNNANFREAETQLNFDVVTDINNIVNLITELNISFNTNLFLNLLNNLIIDKNITFNTDVELLVLNQLIANISIDLNTLQNLTAQAAGAGEILASISFLATVNQLQSNNITIEKAVNLIVSLDEELNNTADRLSIISLLATLAQNQESKNVVTGDINLNIQLDQNQSNLAARVSALTFDLAVQQVIETQLNYNVFVNLASALSTQISTDGEVLASVIFNTSLGQQVVNTKTTSEAINLSIQSNLDTEIHLIARGNISLATEMSTDLFKQLSANSNITFGHLLGLTSIGNANFSTDITFSTIQDFSIDGFLIKFTIVTPTSRILKVFIEDRTIIVDKMNRVTVVKKP